MRYNLKMKLYQLIGIMLAVIIVFFGAFYFFINKSNVSKKEINTTTSKGLETILAFGDSLTYGLNVETVDSYPLVLDRKIKEEGFSNYEVVKFAKSGDTSEMGLAKVDKALSDFKPDLVLLEFGANDFLQKIPAETAYKNISSMIEKIKAERVQVVLIGIEPPSLLPNSLTGEYKKIYRDLANEYGIVYVKNFLDGVLLDKNYTQEDRMHPNKDGYKKIVNENIWPVLVKELSK
jgi:acyl-CoA thioesterase-1